MKETMDPGDRYTDSWKSGTEIYIQDRYSKDDSKRYSTGKTPVNNSGSRGTGECENYCQNQPECKDRGFGWKNVCRRKLGSAATGVEGRCGCTFKRVVVHEQPIENFMSIGAYNHIMKNTPNLPIWKDPLSENRWSKLTKRTNITTWGKLKKSASKLDKTLDMANISFSFWVYFDEALGKTRPYVSIFQFSKQMDTNSGDFYVRDTALVVLAEYRKPVLRICYFDGGWQRDDNSSWSTESDMYGSNNIGYNHLPSFVFITIQSNVIRLYVDGIEQNKYSKGYISQPSNDYILSSGVTYMPKNQDPKGISIRDFQIYAETVPKSSIETIYNYVKDIVPARGWTEGFSSTIESFATDRFDDKTFSQASIRDMNDNLQYSDLNSNIHSSVKTFADRFEMIKVGSQTVTITNPSIGLEDTKLRTPDGTSCYRNYDEKTPSNYQTHPEYNTYHVSKVERVIGGVTTDVTDRIREVLKEIEKGKQVLVESDVNLKNFLLHIQLKNGWKDGLMDITPHVANRDNNTFTMYYNASRVSEFYDTMSKQIKCNNKLDTDWLGHVGKNTCAETEDAPIKTCGSSAPKCENYIATYKWGKCTAETNNNGFARQTETLQTEDNPSRNLDFVKLDGLKEEFLELNIDPVKEKDIMFSDQGTTIAMWFKIDPANNKPDRSSCRLLEFCDKQWTNTKNDVIINIDSKMGGTLRVGIRVEGYNQNNVTWSNMSSTQVLDNKWHHIVWMLKPRGPIKPSYWVLYHNGKPLGLELHPYPPQTVRNTKIIGGPAASPVDHFWGPSIADFKIFKGILNPEQIWKLYSMNI